MSFISSIFRFRARFCVSRKLKSISPHVLNQCSRTPQRTHDISVQSRFQFPITAVLVGELRRGIPAPPASAIDQRGNARHACGLQARTQGGGGGGAVGAVTPPKKNAGQKKNEKEEDVGRKSIKSRERNNELSSFSNNLCNVKASSLRAGVGETEFRQGLRVV